MVTIGSFIVIALMTGLGYVRGVARLGVAFLALLLASLLAGPLHPLTGWAVRAAGAPKLLVPSLATLATGVLLFFLLAAPALKWVKSKVGEERPAWDAPLGAVAGIIWGLTLVLLTLTGLATVGRLDRAMRIGTAESAIRAEARRKFEREAEAEMRPLRPTMSAPRYEAEKQKLVAEAEESFYLEPAEVRKRAGEGSLDTFLVDLEHSPFDGVVEKVSPVTVDTEKVLRDLTIVVGNPELFEKFRQHPTVSGLMNDPHMVALSENSDVAQAVIEGRYRDLLDHPKLIEAVEDKEVREKFSKVDIAKILEEVRGGPAKAKSSDR